jgi:hydrogenase nickel incorporation protein HypA/HybF
VIGMHEYAIVQALLERVETEARERGAVAVHRLALSIGDVAGVEPDLLAAAFTAFRERTICAGAALDIRSVPARWTCPRCARAIARGAVLRCPACGVPARLAAGDEIVLDRIEMELADV